MECLSCLSAEDPDRRFCTACGAFMRRPEAGGRAGVGWRFVAALLELALFLGPAGAFMVLAGTRGLEGLRIIEERTPTSLAVRIALLVGIVGFFAWPVVMMTQGRSPGKLLLGLRIVDARTGEPLGFYRMQRRNWALGWFFGLGFFQALVDPDGRAWWDKREGSVVVDDRRWPVAVQPEDAPRQPEAPSVAEDLDLSEGRPPRRRESQTAPRSRRRRLVATGRRVVRSASDGGRGTRRWLVVLGVVVLLSVEVWWAGGAIGAWADLERTESETTARAYLEAAADGRSARVMDLLAPEFFHYTTRGALQTSLAAARTMLGPMQSATLTRSTSYPGGNQRAAGRVEVWLPGSHYTLVFDARHAIGSAQHEISLYRRFDGTMLVLGHDIRVGGRELGLALDSAPAPQKPGSGVAARSAAGEVRWVARAALPTAREHHGVVAASNGRVYAFGGCTGLAPPPDCFDGSLDEYDPASDRWIARARAPTARSGAVLAAHRDGTIFAIGGETAVRIGRDTYPIATALMEEYEPATDSWHRRSSLTVPRRGHAAVAATNGKIYVVGGQDPVRGTVASAEVYDVSTDRWTVIAPMPVRAAYLGMAAAANGRIYAVGGVRAGDVSLSWDQSISSLLMEYDPMTDRWAVKASLPGPRAELAVASVANRIYAAGGYSTNLAETHCLNQVDEYSIDDNAWSTRAPMSARRCRPGLAASPAGILYAVGGSERHAGSNSSVEAGIFIGR